MTKLRVNAPVADVTLKIERYAKLAGELALAEASREEALTTTNAVADRIAVPIVKEMEELRAEIEPWWVRQGATLLTGKRKTVELGGCMIGSKAGRSSLQFAGGDDTAALAALREHKWAKPYVRVTYAVDKTATAAGLTGKHAAKLRELGFTKPAGAEVFILEPVKQAGTVAG